MIMETTVLIIIAFVLGWKINEFIMAHTFRKILDELKVSDQALRKLVDDRSLLIPEDTAAEKPRGPTVEIKIEQHQGQLLAFEATKDTFLAQGQDPDMLLSRIVDIFPVGTKIVIDNDHGGELIKAAADRLKSIP